MKVLSACLAGGLIAIATAAIAQTPPATAPAGDAAAKISRGQTVFGQRCKDCHDPAIGEAPEKAELAMIPPDEIFTTLKSGLMQTMAAGLSDDDMHAVAAYLTTKPG